MCEILYLDSLEVNDMQSGIRTLSASINVTLGGGVSLSEAGRGPGLGDEVIKRKQTIFVKDRHKFTFS